MKGLLFTELLEMVEEKFGYNTANSIIQESNLSSKGIYTAAKSYHRNEMSLLFQQLHRHTKISVQHLSVIFGKHLSRCIPTSYPQHLTYIKRIFALIGRKKNSNGQQAVEAMFTFSISQENCITIIYNPAVEANCITDGIIHGYLAYFNNLNSVEETELSNGKRKYVLSVN